MCMGRLRLLLSGGSIQVFDWRWFSLSRLTLLHRDHREHVSTAVQATGSSETVLANGMFGEARRGSSSGPGVNAGVVVVAGRASLSGGRAPAARGVDANSGSISSSNLAARTAASVRTALSVSILHFVSLDIRAVC